MRFRFRYSLKVFLLLWLLIGLGLGWFGIHWQKAKRQAAAVKAIQFGYASYDYGRLFDIHQSFASSEESNDWEYKHWNDQPLELALPFSQAEEPEWLLNIFGVDFFHPITSYSHIQWQLGGGGVKPTLTAGLDREMDQLAALPRLRQFSLRPNRIDVPQLMQSNLFDHLGKMKELEDLDLLEMPLEAEHLAPLRNHPRLRLISLRSAEMNDQALAALGTLPALQELDLYRCTEIGKTGFSVLGKWKQLRCLEMAHTSCDDRLAAQLAKLTELEALDLSGTSVGMETLRTLRQLPHLKRLNLSGSQFTDAQLAKVFHGWSSLVTLDLSSTNAGERFASICLTLTGLRYLSLKETPLANDNALMVPMALLPSNCKLELGMAEDEFAPFFEGIDSYDGNEASNPFQ